MSLQAFGTHRRIERLDNNIKRYLVELDRADRDAAAVLPGWVDHLNEMIAKVAAH